MKKSIYILFVIIFVININRTYSQDKYDESPHRYIVTEAWEFLKNSKPNINWNNTYMASALNEVGCGDDDEPWTIGNIPLGACREDREDPIYLIGFPSPTVTHFWKADLGDNWRMDLPSPLPDYPNAYKKAKAYYKSHSENQILFIKHLGMYNYNISKGLLYSYDNLFDFYNTGHCYFWGYMDVNDHQVILHNPPLEINMTISSAKKFSYLILGRIAHLLSDMSVPCHAHGLSHENGEEYENYINANYSNWNNSLNSHYPVFLGPEPFINLSQKNDPLRYLFYITNQIADRFPASPYGNASDPGNTSYINNIGVDNYSLYLEPIYASIMNNVQYLNNNDFKGDYCFNFSIKAVAALLFWFAENTNQIPPPIPDITSITSNMIGYPDPNIGFTLFKGQTGALYSTVQGSPVLYQWNYSTCNSGWLPWPYANNGIFTQSSQGSPHFILLNQNFEGQFCAIGDKVPSALHFYTKLRAYNNSGEDWSDLFRINPTTNLAGGGCPYIFVLGNDTSGGKFFTENNILHHSEFTENANQSITDVYKLKTVPKIDSNKITIQIMETENDVNYFDQIKLFAVDHPVGSKIGITESNDIVMYYPNDVSSSDLATKNFSINNIAPYIQYGQPSPKITGSNNDFVNAYYDSTSQNSKMKSYKNRLKAKGYKTISDSLALIGEIGSDGFVLENNSTAKDWAGSISIYTNSDTYSKPFSKRVNVSDVIIPFSQTNDNVDHIDINFNSDYAMSYFSVVPVSYEGFTKTELSLISAIHAVNGNILSSLSNIDYDFAIMDTTAIIDLKFGSINPPDPSMVRDYVFVVNGRYASENSSTNGHQLSPMINNNVSSNNVIYKYKLNANYPNPFNPSTKINYELEKSGLTKLEVFDILGRSVKVLVNEYKQAGNYTFEFIGSNLPSGVYIYRIESNGFVSTKRMVLIK